MGGDDGGAGVHQGSDGRHRSRRHDDRRDLPQAAAFHGEQLTSVGVDAAEASLVVAKGHVAWRAAYGNVEPQ
jgi:hypothetical protein